MSSRFIVIGSNSFSGSNFIHHILKKKHKVLGLSRSKEINSIFLPYKNINKNKTFKFLQMDLNYQLDRIIKLMHDFKPEYIINFAAQGMVAESWKNPTDWYKTNVLSQVKLHDHLRKFSTIKKYLHFTTPEVYGNTNKLCKESFNFQPSTPYAVSRASCDLHLMSFFKSYKFPVVFTRAANVYGPAQQLYRIIPKTMLFARLGKKIKLHGGGLSRRSFIHINDVSEATLKVITKGIAGETYHISTKEFISIKELVKKISKMTNVNIKNLVEISDERLGKDQAYLLDAKKIRKDFGWKDKINLSDGLQSTLRWIDDNINILKKLPVEYKHKK